MLLDMSREIERVLAHEALGRFGVAFLQRLDDPHMIGDRTRGTVVLRYRDLADRAHVKKEVRGDGRDWVAPEAAWLQGMRA